MFEQLAHARLLKQNGICNLSVFQLIGNGWSKQFYLGDRLTVWRNKQLCGTEERKENNVSHRGTEPSIHNKPETMNTAMMSEWNIFDTLSFSICRGYLESIYVTRVEKDPSVGWKGTL